MNTLSLYLYLMGVLDGLLNVAVAFAICSGVATAMCLFIYVCTTSPHEEREHAEAAWWGKRLLTVFVVSLLLSVFTPSSTTTRLILASELGETVITNPEVIEVFDLLKEELKNQLQSKD